VLSHEIAHITLGYTDSLMARILRLASASGAPDGALGDPLSYRSVLEELQLSAKLLQCSLSASRLEGWRAHVGNGLKR